MSALSKGLFLSLLLSVQLAGSVFSQVTGDYRSNAATFNWTATASWQRWNGAAWAAPGASGYPGELAVPGTVTILNGHTVTLNVTPAQSIGNLVVGGGTSGVLTIADNTARILTMTGSVTISSGASLASNNPGAVRVHGLILGGDFTNNGGTFTPVNGNGSIQVTFNGGGAQAINGTVATQTFNNIIVNKSGGTLSVGGSTATLNAANFTQTLGSFTAPATFSATGTVILTAGTFTAGANTSVGGDFTNNGGTFTPGANTVTFNGAGAQAINGTAATQTFNNLVVNKSGGTLSVSGSTTTLNAANFTQTLGSFTAPPTFSATGTVILTAGTFTAGANTNIGGDFTNNGGTFTPGANTVTFNGSAAQAINGSATTQTFNTLTVNKSGGTVSVSGSTTTINVANLNQTLGNFTAPATLSASGSIIISSGTYSAGANTNISGNLTNNGGTFTGGANTVTFNGAGAKTIGGSGTFTFQNLTLNTTGSANVNVNTNITINGSLSWGAPGLLVVGTNDVTLGSSAVISSPSATQYIQLDGTAEVNSQLIRVNNNTIAAWQFLFPIGTATGGYTPLDLTNAGTTITNAPSLNSTLAVKAILSSDAVGKLKRTFRMTVSGNSNATTLSGARFSYVASDVSFAESIASYNNFWYQRQSNGVWSSPGGTAPGANIFIGPSAAQPLTNDTYFFTIGTSNAYGTTWYSYQSGNWSNPLSWTTDGSIFPVYANPTNAVPNNGDNVFITSGRTISMDINNVSITGITVVGTLDILATTGHSFTTISGSGRIKIAGATDNFPSGTATNFADNAIGGTVEVNGTGISLNAARTFNNLIINMNNSATTATLLNDITLNGDLTITTGLFQFNDNAAAINRNFRVNGNVSVTATGGIRTGTANARHEFNLYGDFINAGTAYFTNRTVANTAAEATDGIVDVNFLSGARNQQAVCNGVTRFYRIEITKGVDDTYKVTLSASAAANFNLFGAANYDINEATASANGNGTNLNALGLNSGTVEIGSNVSIAPLNTTGNYAIYQQAQLWVNGGSVSKTAGAAIVPYGRVRVSSGTLTSDVGSGLTLRASGIIQIDGGTVTAQAIRTSVGGAGDVGSYIQSGGNVTLTGGAGVNADYAVFSLTYTGNVFNMSGGTLTIQNITTTGTGGLRGAIFINSDPANVNVTGGTVIMDANTGINYRITSRATFWNVAMTASAGARTLELLGTTSGTGGGAAEPSVAIQPLVVLNDFTIQNNATFVTNNSALTVGGNFEIQNGGAYTSGTNTTTINGFGVSSLIFGNTGATQGFNNLTINKTNATDEATITTGNATALRVSGVLTVSNGIFDYGTFIASARGTVTLASSGTIGKSTSTGRLLLDGTSAQTLNSSSGTIHNVEINNSNNVTLATGNLNILRTLTLTTGNFNIATFKLTLNGAAANIAGSSFSATKMIQTSANASDGGLELYVDANETLTYPIGVSGKYTPVTAAFTSFSDDGLVRINPVNGILQTTNLSGGADILAYYWRVGSSNFTTRPTVVYTFTYDQTDVGGTETNYFPGKVLDNSPFTRSSETPGSKVNTTINVVTFNGSGTGFTLEEANYTAGAATRFTGTVRVFYTIANGNWNDVNTWSFTRGGASAGAVPVAGDIVVLRRLSVSYSGLVTVTAQQFAARVIFDDENGFSSGCPRLIINTGAAFTSNFGVLDVASTHQGGTPIDGNSHGAVVQYNVDNTYGGVFPSGDFGGFNNYLNALVLYSWQGASTGTITLSSAATQYPQIWFEGGSGSRFINFPNTNVTVNGRAFITGGFGAIRANGGNVAATLNFRQNLFIGSSCCGNGTFQFQGGALANQIVKVDGSIFFTGGGTNIMNILTPASGTRSHRLIVLGDIDLPSGTTLNLGSGSAAETNVVLELQGTTNNTFTNAGSATLSRIVMNKGASIANSFTFTGGFTLTGATNTATKAVELQNGLLVFNNAAINVVLTSGGGNFDVPSTAGIEVRAGTISTTTTNTNANITLSGLLLVSGGTATIDAGAGFPNDIEYSNSGNASIQVTSGTLTVGGQVRRSLTTTTGILNYTQSGGTVVIANRGAAANTRGVFEVLNTGSQFNHSGGSFTIVRGNGSATVPSLWLEPASSTITSASTITIGNASTPSSTIGLQSTATLNNLTLAGTTATATTAIYITPLTVNGNLTINANNALNAQSFDLTIGGNFVVNGTYTPGTNLTTFTNTGAASISGSSATNFYNFTKTGAGVLTLARDINVTRDLRLSAGTLATATFALNLTRNAEIDATISSTSGSGLVFSGTSQQQLTRSASGTGNLGIVTVNNSTGVIIPDGNGYDFTISTNLRLQSGVFDIGGSLLSLGSAALITPVSAFSATNMIQTNSSFTDKGVRKQFPLNYTTNFVFPVGQLYYTPVTFDFGTPGNTTGTSGTPTITVRPSNRRHPITTDPANVLQYYWLIGSTNVANTFRSSMTLQYVQPLVAVVSPNTETDYIAARILSNANPSLLVNKFSTADVVEASNTINFNFTGVTQDGIAGDYFAGVSAAIPNSVPIYTTTGSGNVDAAIYTPIVGGGGAPTGAQVIVAPGHNLTFNTNSINLYLTQISAGAIITIPSGSIGHSLGTLSGTGDLQINSNTTSAVLPAAVYDTFLSCAGGGLIFGGTGNYDILGGITLLRNLTLTGSGTKALANNDITICNDLNINNGTFNNSNGQIVTVQNDVLLNAGAFNNLAGTLTITRDFTQTLGTFDGGTAGTKTIGRNLTVNGGTFTPGSGSANIIQINGNMTVAGGATITTGSGGATGQRFTFGGTSAQTLTGTFTSTRAFNRLEINNSTGLTVAGNTTINSEVLLTSGLITPSSSSVVILLEANAVSTPAAGSSTSFVNGKLYKILANGQSFTFPIGKGIRWRSGSVGNVSQSGSVTWDMEYIQAPATGAVASAPPPRNNPVNNFTSADPLVLRMSGGEHWRVSDGSATSNGRTAIVGLSWGIQSDVSANLAQREAMKVMSWNGTNWTNNGGTNFQPGGAHTQTRGTFESTSTLSFSENIVLLGSTEIANPLPVTLVKFEGVMRGSIAELSWKTASEVNNDYFEVQRSSDGFEFVTIGKVNGNGTTSNFSQYSFEDRKVSLGKNYYRLKQIDFDGKADYSKVIVLNYDGSALLDVFLYPNPTTSSNINVELVNSTGALARIRIFDVTGKISIDSTFEAAELDQTISVKSEQLKSGVYFVEVTQGVQRIVKRLVIN